MYNTPTLHKSIPMNTRVRVPKGMFSDEDVVGTVVGISSLNIIFYYIVALDKSIDSEWGEFKAISVPGTYLKSEDGLSDWRN